MSKEQLDVIEVIAFCVVGLAAVQGIVIYSVVRYLATGRSLFERKASRGPADVHQGQW